jgi:AcrR family transcriptional regulator
MTLSLRDFKRSLTEQTIVEKAMALFRLHGFAQVSVRQIAKAAVVSEKTVFNYFPYKELIVLAGAQPGLTEIMDAIQKEIDNIAEPTEVLRKFGADMMEWCTANPEAACIVIAELLSPDAERLYNAARSLPDFYNPIRTVITLARAQGKLRPGVGVEYATTFYLSNVFTVIRTHVAVGELDRLRPMLNTTLEIFLHGAFAETTS